MGNLETDERADLRLRLRKELKKLIELVDIYQGGSPIPTPELAPKALEDMATVCSKRRAGISQKELWAGLFMPGTKA
jgi:hypothetical protein